MGARKFCFAGAAGVGLLLLSFICVWGRRVAPWEDTVYVWQRDWTPAVAKGLARARDRADAFMVLACESEDVRGRSSVVSAHVDWEAVSRTGRGVWLTVRANSRFAESIASTPDELAGRWTEAARAATEVAKAAGAKVLGVQFDYDCPTERLGDYATLLRRLLDRSNGMPLSITALPTWLGQTEFTGLLTGLDHFVLQVHSLERPASIDSPFVLCNASKIDEWTRRASAFGVPYYVALPTYGYRVFFDAAGEFAALGAEGCAASLAGCTAREVRADPVALAEVVRGLRAKPPKHCRGIAWFRMPVATDTLNWSWPLLECVMAGKTPMAAFEAEARSPRKDLFEVWVKNVGAFRPSDPIRIPVRWTNLEIRASDLVNDFRGENPPSIAGVDLVGPSPEPGAWAMAGWFVVGGGVSDTGEGFRVESVEVLQ